jgi:hypothetical protein
VGAAVQPAINMDRANTNTNDPQIHVCFLILHLLS